MDTATDSVDEPRTDSGAGFDALFEELFETMKRLAHLLGADDPENIAQESFVRLHLRWHREDHHQPRSGQPAQGVA